MEHDLVQEYPIHQGHIFIQVGPISCSQRSKRFNLEHKEYHDVNAHLLSAATNNTAKYTIKDISLTQVTKGLVMNCSRRGVKISFSILQIIYSGGGKGEVPQIRLGNWSLNVEVGRNQ